MIKSILRCFTILAFVVAAWAEPLQIKFEAFKVQVSSDGTEKFITADQAAPGDLIEYRAAFTNGSSASLHGLKPEIPIPAGLVIVLGSDQPSAVEGSSDGTVFKALPLLDGAGQPLPAEQIRALRWQLKELPPAETARFRLRATVTR
mgnify:CR=1 FL=1